MGQTFEINCAKCQHAHPEVKVTLSQRSGDNDIPPSMLIEYPLVCRAPKWVYGMQKDGETAFKPQFRGQEVENWQTCDAALAKSRKRR